MFSYVLSNWRIPKSLDCLATQVLVYVYFTMALLRGPQLHILYIPKYNILFASSYWTTVSDPPICTIQHPVVPIYISIHTYPPISNGYNLFRFLFMSRNPAGGVSMHGDLHGPNNCPGPRPKSGRTCCPVYVIAACLGTVCVDWP